MSEYLLEELVKKCLLWCAFILTPTPYHWNVMQTEFVGLAWPKM